MAGKNVGPDPLRTNVCTETGKQKTLQDDFDRPAINSKDNRGGAMGLMFATELMSAASP